MCTKGLKKWALLLTFWVALHTRPLHAQTISGNTVDGNLTVTGTSDLQGNSLTLGTRTDNSNPGAMALYTDGTTSTLEFDVSRSANIWKWQQNGGATLQLQMSLNLSNQNELVLYNQASTPVAQITLNPLGTSTIQNSLTVNGTDNEMPNQTLVNPNSVLTEGLGDGRYLSSSSSGITIGSASSIYGTGSTLSLNGGTATGPHSVAEGYNSTASGLFSTAFGASTTASSRYAFAFGSGAVAMGSGSTAFGQDTSASGSYSTTSGVVTSASGYCSTASGYFSNAQGVFSNATGIYTQATSYASFAVGCNNVGGGNPTAWVATDPIFEVGNGVPPSNYQQPYWNSSNIPSDALVVYKNGNTTISGFDNEMPNQTLVGSNSVLTEGLADGRYIGINGSSIALFSGASAPGTDATAIGDYTTASGANAFATGLSSTASGIHAAAFNDATMAAGYDSFVVGANNVGGGDPANWVPTDPLFEIGNGVTGNGGGSNSYNPTPSDALVVYKNGNTTVNGTDNEMPNQTLVNGNSVLTEGLADSRYLSSSSSGITSGSGTYWGQTGPTMSLDGASATGPYSFAEGPYSSASAYASVAMGVSSASGDYSTAFGRSNVSYYAKYATATGYSYAGAPSATALGMSTASGYYSMSMGYQSNAVGWASTAMGGQTTANGFFSTAMGCQATASGYYSAACGEAVTSQALNSFVIGVGNVGGGSKNAWVSTDPLFEIGNGNTGGGSSGMIPYEVPYSATLAWGGNPAATGPSDALVVYKNGNTAVQGTVTAGGTVTAPTFVTTAQSGDIPMYQGN